MALGKSAADATRQTLQSMMCPQVFRHETKRAWLRDTSSYRVASMIRCRPDFDHACRDSTTERSYKGQSAKVASLSMISGHPSRAAHVNASRTNRPNASRPANRPSGNASGESFANASGFSESMQPPRFAPSLQQSPRAGAGPPQVLSAEAPLVRQTPHQRGVAP